MKFSYLKRYADIRTHLDEINDHLSGLKHNSMELFASRKKRCIEEVIAEFSEFFSLLGFQIDRKEDHALATYKMITIMLRGEDPGRREGDIPCILRYRLSISGARDEIYTIYVKPEPNHVNVPAETEFRMTPEQQSVEKLLEGLNRLQQELNELRTSTQALKGNFDNDESRSVTQSLVTLIDDASRKISIEIEQWRDTARGTFIYMVSKDRDEWQNTISGSFATFYEFLESLESG